MLQLNLHVQCTLGLGCFLPAAVANQSAALSQAEVEGQQGAVLHADSPQCGAIDLEERRKMKCERLCVCVCACDVSKLQ